MFLLSQKTLENYLSQICDCQALEIHADKDNIYIPYMMNDALECYLLFPNGQMTGLPLSDYEGDTSFEVIQKTAENNKKTGLIFRQDNHNVFTIWYTCAYQELHCYRYDRIGHFWVSGQEHWRRLVYILGTIYDKYEYLGDRVCNPREIDLLKLIEFSPFHYYSPIREPLNHIYPDTLEGVKAMEALAMEAKAHSFIRLLRLYRYFHFSGMRKIIQWALNRPARVPLYELLFHKIEEASSCYPERDYGNAQNQYIANARKQLSVKLKNQGYQGEYPLFQKDNHQILAMEEHPFTILEAKHFQFRIQLMKSETAGRCHGLNAGFFHGKGNKSCIIKPDTH